MAKHTFQHNRTIDFLKGVFTLFVITLHYPIENSPFWLTAIFRFAIQFAVPGFLFLSGYVQALSFGRRDFSSLADAYDYHFMFPKLFRILAPYTFFFVFEYILFRLTKVYIVNAFKHGLLSLFFDYLIGGNGQGGYYTPLILQFLLLFPVIYFIIRRKGFRGVLWLLGFNIGFEVLKQAYGMSDSEYRLLVFRYLFIMACGCYTALSKDEHRTSQFLPMFFCMLTGIGFIILFQYTSYGEHAKIITKWQGTSVLTAFYPITILYFIIKKIPLAFRPLEWIGQASFHVFLVQMLYYHYWYANFKDAFPPLPGYFISLTTCTILGILFWMTDSRLRNFKSIKQAKTPA